MSLAVSFHRVADPQPVAAESQHPAFDVVVIGASAGGLTALGTLLGALPADFPVGIALVLHLSPDHPSFLTEILARHTGRVVAWAEHDADLAPGVIYVAPPDRHLEFGSRGELTLASTPRVQFSRPSIDRLFVSAAQSFADRALGVVLTGNGRDGRDGAVAIRRAGGVVIAQDESSSEYFSMPRGAIAAGAATFVLPLDAICPAIVRLVRSRDDHPGQRPPGWKGASATIRRDARRAGARSR